MKLESLLQYLDLYLGTSEYPDYPAAWNGLQVGGPEEVGHLVAAVDASAASIDAAVARRADLLIVHHGLFWGGPAPITGRLLRRVRPLIERGVALYSSHLPLDGHPEVGNNALLGKALGLALEGRFDAYHGTPIGWYGRFGEAINAASLAARAAAAVGGPTRIIEGGPGRIERVGVVTGAGGDALVEAAALGLDALVTGECHHHHAIEAMELGVHLVLAGHYATETFGVQALAAHAADRFGLTWEFVDLPTGL
jgi:dinuclear metal center YbgI/SA1388 family protein